VPDVDARVEAHAPTIARAVITQRPPELTKGEGGGSPHWTPRPTVIRYGPQGVAPFNAASTTVPSTISNT